MDCVYELISTMLPGMTASDIFLSLGIANKLCRIDYAGMQFYVVNGRGIFDPIDILGALEVPYQCVTLYDLFQETNYDNIICFCAKDFLLRSREIKPKVKQLLPYYSAFYVAEKKQNEIVLKIYGDEHEFKFSEKDLERMSEIRTCPIPYPFQFVKIQNRKYIIDNTLKKNLLRSSVNTFLKDTGTDGVDVSGSGMYEAFLDVLRQFTDKAAQDTTDRKAEMLRHRILSASMNAGTVGLYRREFAAAVKGYYGPSTLEAVAAAFVKSAAIWRELGKRAIRQVNENASLLDVAYLKFAEQAIEEIRDLELHAMAKLKVVL